MVYSQRAKLKCAFMRSLLLPLFMFTAAAHAGLAEGLAASRNGDDTQYNFALLYGTGKSLVPDLVQAWAWFDAAFTRAGKDNARKNRDVTAQRMTPVQIEQAKKVARDYAAKYVAPFGKGKAP